MYKMKKLLTLVLFCFILISCESTPEKKILHSFNFRHKEMKAKDIKIYDTLYAKEIDINVSIINNKIQILEKQLKSKNIANDSLFIIKKYIEKDLERLYFQQLMNDNLISNDSICAYYARITTNKDTFNFVIEPFTYRIVCPVFMIE